jgi:hypothetical protein
MQATAIEKNSIVGLFRLLIGDVRTFIRQEVRLVKTEFSEKFSRLTRFGVIIAAGGLVAYAGLIVFLIGLSWLIAWLLELAGLQPVLAGFVGLAIIGLLVIATGSVLLFKGLKTLSRERLSPERTLHTLQELRGTNGLKTSETVAKPKSGPSSAEMQIRVEATGTRMGETLDELGYRLSPRHLNAEVKQQIRSSPYHYGALAMGAGVMSGLLLRNRRRKT